MNTCNENSKRTRTLNIQWNLSRILMLGRVSLCLHWTSLHFYALTYSILSWHDDKLLFESTGFLFSLNNKYSPNPECPKIKSCWKKWFSYSKSRLQSVYSSHSVRASTTLHFLVCWAEWTGHVHVRTPNPPSQIQLRHDDKTSSHIFFFKGTFCIFTLIIMSHILLLLEIRIDPPLVGCGGLVIPRGVVGLLHLDHQLAPVALHNFVSHFSEPWMIEWI